MSELTNNTKELEHLETQLKKQNSLPQSFLRGLITALGATVGLSIILGLVALVVSYLAQIFGLESFLDPLMQSFPLSK